MSVEKQVKSSRRRMLFWRVAGEVLYFPALVLRVAGKLLQTLAEPFANVTNHVFTMELDAAREYYALTGLDLGSASGEPNRYAGVLRASAGWYQAHAQAVVEKDFGPQ